MSIKLKLKSKSLSEEARIIRIEERKLLRQYRWNLKNYSSTGNNNTYSSWDDKSYRDYVSINSHRKK
jgi:hypothetical protein